MNPIFYTSHSIFGVKHLIILAVCITAIVLGVIFGRKLKLNTMLRILLIVGIVSESIKVIYYIITNENSIVDSLHGDTTYSGYLPKTDLPFHLCSIQIIFILILNLSKNENLKKLIMSFMLPTCLIGGVAALFIATSSSLNGLWILSLQYFGYHVAITIFSIYLFCNKEVTFTIKDYRNCILMLVATLFIAIYINSALADYVHDINFMYVVNPPMSGLPFLTKKYGWGVYITHYALLCLFAATLCYIYPIIKFFKGLKKKPELN